MKIAHVTATFPPYWGGTGNVAYHNARLMHERGHEVTVFTAARPASERREPPVFPFAVERLPTRLRIGNAAFTPSLLAQLRGFDLIHLHYPSIFAAEIALLAAQRSGAPLVVTYHNQLQETNPVKRALFGLYNLTSEPLLLARAARILAVRREHLESLHPRLRGDPRVRELPNGVDTERFTPHDPFEARAELGLPIDAPIALFVGALDQAHRFKNVDGLIEALARLESLEAALVIVGDGDLRPSLESLAARRGVAERVRFVGAHAPDALPPLYSAADVTVLPSTGVESFGVVLIESMACGTPVIVSSLPGVRTLVEPGVDGWLVPPGDTEALRRALDTALADRAATAAMAEGARGKAVAGYDWQVVGDELEAIYRDALQQDAGWVPACE